jgi:GH15 family glucan-1,4-alpha-glucosidase
MSARAVRRRAGSARHAEPLVRPGRVEHAVQLIDELVGVANDVALHAEEIEPTTGAVLGNMPQGRSQPALISAALALAEEMER